MPDHIRSPEEILAYRPLKRILEVLKRKKYSGPLSFESFKPAHIAMDPYELATKVRAAVEPIIKSVG